MVSACVVPGFEAAADVDLVATVDDDELPQSTRQLVTAHNRRSGSEKRKKSGGGFQTMGFSGAVLRGIARRGYKQPTPIQRKCMPLILDGRDVVAMARTGSGKTACFLLPLLERLQTPSQRPGARALILSPTRELALQTLRFVRELGRFVSVRAAVVLGGDSMEQQFAALHDRPDVVVATPGRFVHVCVEMQLRLDAVEYVVFDEADRLFELGFAEQLREILARLPDTRRQTLLFSATLPSALVQFARAGLSEPLLVRLDTEQQLSQRLQLAHVQCRDQERPLVLLQLLEHVVPSGQRTVVFVPTRHHVEYVRQLLECAGIGCTFLYSSMEPSARRDNAERFRAGGVAVLVVTDVAARGIDIPQLDYVINYNFPATCKLFVHRVGRVARAGRAGTAISLLSPAETPYLFDLYLFLGGDVRFADRVSKDKQDEQEEDNQSGNSETGECSWNGVLGAVPQRLIDAETERIRLWHASNAELSAALCTSQNACKQYERTRAPASKASVRRTRQCDRLRQLNIHPIFADVAAAADDGSCSKTMTDFMEAVRSFKVSKTIFEVGATTQTEASRIMQAKRQRDAAVIERAAAKRLKDAETDVDENTTKKEVGNNSVATELLEQSSQADLDAAFETVASKRPRKNKKHSSVMFASGAFRDSENYIPHVSKSHHSDAGYAVSSDFERQSSTAVLDLTTDDTDDMRRRQMRGKHWDRKKKAFVGHSNDGKNRKIKTESGQWIAASFQKSGRYDQWKKLSHIDAHRLDEEENAGERQSFAARGRKGGRQCGVRVLGYRQRDRMPQLTSEHRANDSGLRTSQEIVRRRDLAEKRRRRSTVGVGRSQSKRGAASGSIRSTRGARGSTKSSRGASRSANASHRNNSFRGSSKSSGRRGSRRGKR